MFCNIKQNYEMNKTILVPMNKTPSVFCVRVLFILLGGIGRGVWNRATVKAYIQDEIAETGEAYISNIKSLSLFSVESIMISMGKRKFR
jgi:hypothetical protein